MKTARSTIRSVFPAMGTIFSFTIRSCPDPDLPGRIRRRIGDMDSLLTAFGDSGDCIRLREYAGQEPIGIADDTWKLLRDARLFSTWTDGAFDVTAGPASMLWKKALKEQTLPDEEELSRARALTNYRSILLYDVEAQDNRGTPAGASHAAVLADEGMSVDFGGIAKGYAVDVAAGMLIRAGVEDAFLNFGGSVRVIGPARQVGIKNPFQPDRGIFGSVHIKNAAIVTSAAYERHARIGSSDYHHIIDPRTGRPSRSDLLSVTLIGPNACELDALATAIFILGEKEGARIAEEHELDAIFVNTDGVVRSTPGIAGSFKPSAAECPTDCTLIS